MDKHLNTPNDLYGKVAALLEMARQQVVATVNLTMVHTYFEIGKMIVEEEQAGKERAAYGKQILKELSLKLSDRFGKGFSEKNIRNMRQFFLAYANSHIPASQISSVKLKNSDKNGTRIWQMPSAKSSVFTLSWSHYIVLMRIDNVAERSFYEIEAAAQNWSEAQLKRQYHSSLYERLALSRDKEEVIKLANQGQAIQKPADILKNPLTLEFLGLEEKSSYTEQDMESAIINKLQQFLLELGKGFLFEARQKRFTFEEEHFFVDLVFYNRLLQCYVLVDLKTDKLSHQDLGQMQMYVNYYDRYVKLPHEKPTIGMLLCKKKTDSLVQLTLPKEANIYAAEYRLYLPGKQLLQQKMEEWAAELKDGMNGI